MELEVDIEKRFRDFTCRAVFTMTAGRWGVFGPSGSGKSTLMQILAGLLRPDRGTIILDGETVFDSEHHINLTPERRRIGIVFQHAHLFPHMNVRKNLLYGYKRVPRHARTIDFNQLLAMLQLEGLLERSPARLSGGERQRVALARTILACPRLILLDEPLSGLDEGLKYQIIPYLQRVFSEFSLPFLFISHSLQEMRLMTDKVLVMGRGTNQKSMPTEDLARSGIGHGGDGYLNLFSLRKPQDQGQLLRYDWHGVELILVKSGQPLSGQFALSSRDILLFKKHPEATSARNMLDCIVRKTYATDWLVGVELECCGQTLIAEVVPPSVDELEIRPGSRVIAVFKASAFVRLF